jgi:peptide/nickel transport system permease protein
MGRVWRSIAVRALQAVPTALGVTLLTFLLIHMIPGDPARVMLGQHATPRAIDALRTQWGLNSPLPEQYLRYLAGLLHGDLGDSLFYQKPIADIIAPFVAPTLWLIVYGALLSVVISVPIAVVAAVKANRSFDHLTRLACQVALGMPQPWVGLLLILGFALHLQLLPVGGFGDTFGSHVSSMFLPSLTVAISMAPILVRSLRAELLQVFEAEYVAMARAKGLSEARVVWGHSLRNAEVTAVTILGLNVAWLVSSTVVVELVFGVNGLGNLLVTSVTRRDFPLVQALALVFAVLVIVVNMLTDIGRTFLDPRVGGR